MEKAKNLINELIIRFDKLKDCEKDIITAAEILISCFKNGGRLYLCGNGGSAADCAHITGELVKGFLSKRPLAEDKKDALESAEPRLGAALAQKLQAGLPAHNLCESISLNTAVMNDIDPEMIYAQQVFAFGRKGDVLLAISTSGNAKNAAYAAISARVAGMKTVGLTGINGGSLAGFSDVCIKVPESETFMVQELHLPVYHCLCAAVEKEIFGC